MLMILRKKIQVKLYSHKMISLMQMIILIIAKLKNLQLIKRKFWLVRKIIR